MVRTLDARRRVPAMVQRRPEHGHARDPGSVPARRGRRSGATDERPTARRDRRARHRSRPADRLHVRRHASTGFAGDTARERPARRTASTWSRGRRSSVGRAGCSRPGSRSPARSSRLRPPRSEPIVPATGGATRRRDWSPPATARRRTAAPSTTRALRPRAIGTCTSRRSGRRGRHRRAAGRRSRRRAPGDRVMLVDERPWLGGTRDRPRRRSTASRPCRGSTTRRSRARRARRRSRVLDSTRPRSASTTTATWSCTSDQPAGERVHHVRAERVVLATGAHERPIGFRRQRPCRGSCSPRPARLYADRFGVLAGERAVVFSTNHAGHEAAIALGASRRRHRRDRRPRRRRQRHRRRPRAPASTCAPAGRCARADGDPRVRSVHARSAPVERSRRSTPTSCSSPEAGTPRRSSGAASVAAWPGTTTRRLLRARRRRRRAWLVDRRRGGRRGALERDPTGTPRPTTCHGTSSRCSATSSVADVLDAVGSRASLDRAREARHLHRHRDRPGAHERRPDGRDRERGLGCRPRRAGAHEQPAPVHAGPVLGARRTGPRTHAARPDPHDADARAPRRTRRRVRERRPVEAALVLPASRRVDARGGPARVPRRAPRRRSDGRLDARQDRAQRPRYGDVPRPALHEPHVDARRGLDPLRVDARPRRHGRSTTASRCGWPTIAS